MTDVFLQIERAGVIPVVALREAAPAIALCKALSKAELKVVEVTFRTSAAVAVIQQVRDRFPDFLIGAGTLTRPEEVQAAKDAGAQFAVAPGLNPKIVQVARRMDLPFAPGVCTPSEIEAALDLGLSCLKFFPAGACGGLAYLKSIYAPYAHRGVRLIPTGGVGPDNLADYLSHPAVAAVGGTWICPHPLIESKDWTAIEQRARQAKQTVAERRRSGS